MTCRRKKMGEYVRGKKAETEERKERRRRGRNGTCTSDKEWYQKKKKEKKKMARLCKSLEENQRKGESRAARVAEKERERDRKIRKYLLVVLIFTQKRSRVSTQPFSSFLVDIRDGKCIILELSFDSPNILLYLTYEEQTSRSPCLIKQQINNEKRSSFQLTTHSTRTTKSLWKPCRRPIAVHSVSLCYPSIQIRRFAHFQANADMSLDAVPPPPSNV